jgi:hypothetical protein
MRHDDEMKVIGHKASSQEVEPHASLGHRNQIEKRAKVAG